MEGKRIVDRRADDTVDLGIVTMRLVASSSQTGGAFAIGEFRGSEGPWTVPHVHRGVDESFYILDGSFTFTCGDGLTEAEPGRFLTVPRGQAHVMRAGPGGGAFLCIWAPGGLEEMFLELGRLPPESITSPEVRAQLARRYDSVPI